MDIGNLLKKWEKYLDGELEHKAGQNLANHSIKANIHWMMHDDFIFRTFSDAGFEMSKNIESYKKHFCSNKYLARALTKWHQETQSLYVILIIKFNYT